jgi:hypothetical protein
MQGRENGSDIIACPMKSHIELSTWDPKIPTTIIEGSQHLSDYFSTWIQL